MNFESLFVNPAGRTPRDQFVPALITLLAAIAFYAFLVTGRTAVFCMLTLLFPAFVLHARRLHDMGRSAWILLVPVLLLFVAFAIWLHYVSLGTQLDSVVPLAALVVSADIALWSCVGRSRTGG